MSNDGLRPRGPKTNHKKGFAAADKARKRREAEERQVKYDKMTIEQKLAQPHIGAKERARLLARQK